MNSLHTTTREFIIEDELIFKSGDEIDMDIIDETSRNLRYMDIFSSVDISFDSVSNDTYDLIVTTKDRWSTYPTTPVSFGGGESYYGIELQELNLLGLAIKLSADAIYRSEHNIGWQGTMEFKKNRLFRSEYGIDFKLQSSKLRTDQNLILQQPYRTLASELAYGINLKNSLGDYFKFIPEQDKLRLSFHERNIKTWFSKAWLRKDRVFFTLAIEASDVNRGKQEYNRAYDNSGKILLAFSSISQDFIETEKVNNYAVEDVNIGGWGSAILGKIFSIGSKGESLYYVGGQGEQSYYDGNLYLFGQLSAGSGFVSSAGLYTYQEFMGSAFYRLTPDLLIAARLRQQTCWNWFADRQLVLDYDKGLRGYDANFTSGDNRIINNFELRYFPDITMLIAKFSFVAFFDIGSAWNQDTKITQARFFSDAGIGFRIHDSKSNGQNSVFRIDFPYNFQTKSFAGIVFSVGQMFSAYNLHQYKIPELFGIEYDAE